VMVEVFKTDVTDREHARIVIQGIHTTFLDYEANFDLDDCDRILRVQCSTGVVQAYLIMEFLKRYGCHAVILPDEVHAMVD
jgi:hypothetical protein